MSPRGAAHAIVSIDHQGNVFETRKAMCDFLGNFSGVIQPASQ